MFMKRGLAIARHDLSSLHAFRFSCFNRDQRPGSNSSLSLPLAIIVGNQNWDDPISASIHTTRAASIHPA